MHEIICPHCSKAFKIDEAGYAEIQKQVRDSEFDKQRQELEKQLHERLELAAQEKHSALQLAQAQMTAELQAAAAAKEAEILKLQGKLDAEAVAREIAVKDALAELAKERDVLRNQLDQAAQEQLASQRLAAAQLQAELQ